MQHPDSDIARGPRGRERTHDRARPRALVLLGGALAVLAIAAAAWHAVALADYQRSFDRSLTLAQREAAAVQASKMERWDGRLATHATVMTKWLRGSVLLAQDAALPAMLELAAAYKLDVGNTELLALFQQSQAQLSYDSNRKAHLQHGHEGPGGTLRPQDLLR